MNESFIELSIPPINEGVLLKVQEDEVNEVYRLIKK